MCARVCTHSVILFPVLSDAHWEKQIHSEKQIVPLLGVWSGHKEKGPSEKQRRERERDSERERRCLQVWVIVGPGTMYACLSLFHHLTTTYPCLFWSTPEQSLPFAFPSCPHLHAFSWENIPTLTVEMNFSISEYTYYTEFNSSLLRKDLALESIYPWEKPITQLQLAFKHTDNSMQCWFRGFLLWLTV